MPSIYEVAKEAGVSASTVSRTFNTPHMIQAKTRQHVLEVAKRINYRPLRSRHTAVEARSDARQPVSVGFQFFAEWSSDTLQGNAFYSNVLAGAIAESTALGLSLTISTIPRHSSGAPMPAVVNEGVAGLLLVGVADNELMDYFKASASHIVFVDHHDRSGNYDSIVSDNFAGAREAVQYLIGLGHKRIAFVTGDDDVDSFNERLDGYVSAHFWAGLPVGKDSIVRRPFDDNDESGCIRALLEGKNRPTAIMAANDILAFNVIRVCHSIGLRIPQDLSLVGFDDVQFAANSLPPLTSVRAHTEMLGRLAVRRIYTRIAEAAASGVPPLPTCSLVPVELIKRESCAPPSI